MATSKKRVSTSKKTAIPQKKVILVKKKDGTIVKKVVENPSQVKPKKVVRKFIDPTVGNTPTSIPTPTPTPIKVEEPKVIEVKPEQIKIESNNKEELKPVEQVQSNNDVNTKAVSNENNNTSPTKPKKKRHKGREALVALLLFGGVLGAVSYPIYKLITQEQKEEEYVREVGVGSEDITASGKASSGKYIITLNNVDTKKEVDTLVSVKIGDTVIDPSNYTFNKDSQTITFTIEFLKQHEGKIVVTTTSVLKPVIEIDITSKKIEEDSTFNIKVNKIENKKEGDEVKWSSSDTSIATVTGDDKGAVITIKPFTEEEKPDKKTVTIKATLSVSKKYASCSVTISRSKILATYTYYGYDENYEETEEEDKIKYYKVKCLNKEKCEAAIIPEKYNDKPIIGFQSKNNDGAFEYASNLTSIDFEKPENIKEIEGRTFFGCSSLTSFPSEKLTSLETIGYVAFAYSGIVSFKVPKSVTYLDNGIFGGDSLRPETSKFKELLFEDETNTSWVLKNNDFLIYESKGKTGLENATAYTTTYKEYTWIKKVIEEVKWSYTGLDQHGDVTTESESIVGYELSISNKMHMLIESATVPAKNPNDNKPVIKYSNSMLSGCILLNELKFEHNENIEEISNSCFWDCTSLKEVDLTPLSKLKIINRHGFCGCSSLENITLPDSVEQIEEEAFIECKSIKTLNSKTEYECNLPSSIKWIGTKAFAYKEETKEIGEYYYYTPFKSVVFNSSDDLIEIFNDSFGYYDSTKYNLFKLIKGGSGYSNQYYIKNSNSSSENENYIYCGRAQSEDMPSSYIVIPDGCNIIAGGSLTNNDVPESVVYFQIPASVKIITYGAFYNVTFVNGKLKFMHSSPKFNIYKTNNLVYRKEYEQVECVNFNPNEYVGYAPNYLKSSENKYRKWVLNS